MCRFRQICVFVRFGLHFERVCSGTDCISGGTEFLGSWVVVQSTGGNGYFFGDQWVMGYRDIGHWHPLLGFSFLNFSFSEGISGIGRSRFGSGSVGLFFFSGGYTLGKLEN